MSTFRDDIVKDILQRVLEASARSGGVDDRLANQIEREVKRDWGGTEPYIQHGFDKQRAERNEKIYAVYWDEGLRDLPTLSRRFGLSVKQIRRIVGI